jgi:hypothetical protein
MLSKTPTPLVIDFFCVVLSIGWWYLPIPAIDTIVRDRLLARILQAQFHSVVT